MRSRIPLWMLILALVAVAFFVLPLIGLLIEAPWGNLGTILATAEVADAIRVSLIASLAAVVISAVLGVPLAWVLARVDFPGRAVVRGVVLLPLVLPPVVGGSALLFSLGRAGFLGEPIYEATGLVLPFSIWGVVVAVTFVSMPFLIITVEGALRGMDDRYEGAAASLGASRWTVIRKVTLPMIGPSLLAGLVLTWARAIGEFGATITFAGNIPGETQSLTLAVFIALQSNREGAIAISLLLVAISLVVLVMLRDRWIPSR